MTIRLNTAEGGTNGAAVNVANSGGGSGTAFDEVSSAVTYASQAAVTGNLGYRTTAATTQYTRMPIGEDKVNAKANFIFDGNPVGNTPIRVAMTSGALSVIILSSGNPQLYQASVGGKSSGTNPLVGGKKYRVTLFIDNAAGQARASIYEVDTGNAVWDSGVISGLTLAQPTYAYIGKYDTTSVASNWDDISVKSGSDGAYDAGAPSTPLPSPTITVTQSNPTTVNGTDGTITITWPAVANAHHYEAAIVQGTVTAGFTASDTNATSPKKFTGLNAGTYTVAVRAKATA